MSQSQSTSTSTVANQASLMDSPTSPIDIPAMIFAQNATIQTAQHKECYKFIINGPRPINLHVKLVFMDDEAFFDRDQDSENIWLTFDWVVLDWFKNFNRRMGTNQVSDDEVVKAMALAWLEEV